MKTIERLRELEKAATPGPWDVFADLDLCVYCVIGPAFSPVAEVRTRTSDDGAVEDGGFAADRATSSFIAETRNALPALLAVVEAQAAEIEAWRSAEEECRAIENACGMNAARAYIARSRDNTDTALRALEGGDE